MKLQRTDVNQVKKQVPQTLKAIQSDSEPDEDGADDESESSEEEVEVKPKKVLRVKAPKLTQAKIDQAPTRAARSKNRKDASMTREGSKPKSAAKSKPTAAVKTSLRSKLKLGEKRAKPAEDDEDANESDASQIAEKP